MAKLCPPYQLCPIVSDSVFGLQNDSEIGCVLGTFGKKMVMRYKLENQKPIGSWSTKDNFSAPVIYDKSEEHFVGVFNGNTIRLWTASHDKFDTLQKHKFELPIHCLLSQMDNEPSLIVFRNGCICPLDLALKNEKDFDKPLLYSTEHITDCNLCEILENKYAVLVTNSENAGRKLHLISVSKREKLQTFKLYRPGVKILGQAVIPSGHLITLWTDGSLFSMPVLAESSDVRFPGKFLSNVSVFSSKYPACILSLNRNFLAIYGADSQDEGGQLIVYNIKFNFIQSQKHFKSFSNPPRMWNVQSSLAIIVGSNVIIIPYRLELELLSKILGSQRVNVTNSNESDILICTDPETASWATNEKNVLQSTDDISERLGNWNISGMPESLILEELSPQLIEKKDIQTLLWCLNRFSDVSENVLILILEFCIVDFKLLFTIKEEEREELEEEEEHKNGDMDSLRRELLHIVLNSPFDEVSLMNHLRRLPFPCVLNLLCYLLEITNTETMLDKSQENIINPQRIFEWMAVLLDAFYQHIVLSRDPEIYKLLRKVQDSITNQLQSVKHMESLLPTLQHIAQRKPFKCPRTGSKFYSIERITLY